MALHNVPESDSFDTNVQMPADGDAADASDFEASTIRPLTNRSRWFKGKIDYILRLFTGGAVETTENATLTISDGKTLKVESGTGNLDLTDVYTDFAGFVRGHLFESNAAGRANKKPYVASPGAHVTTINPRLYDWVKLTPTANINFQIPVDATYVEGEHFKVVNDASGFQISVKNPAGTNIVVLHSRSADHPSWAEVVLVGGVWTVGPFFQAS